MVRKINKEDTGIKVYYEPAEPSVDIVAIHGLGAHPDDTWSENLNKGKPLPASYVNWLASEHMLPSKISSGRIMRFGYRSQWFGNDDVETGTVDLSAIAERLLSELERIREKSPERPLIFIAHSFGGLVVIKALRKSFDNPENWLFPISRTVGLVFLGVPFRGRNGMSIRDMVKASIQGRRVHQVWPDSLELALPGNEYLRESVKDFTDMRGKDCPIPLWCFYELLPSDVGKLFSSSPHKFTVVSQESACLDQWTEIYRHALERNHYNLNEFGRPDEEGYDKVSGEIAKIADRVSEILEKRVAESL